MIDRISRVDLVSLPALDESVSSRRVQRTESLDASTNSSSGVIIALSEDAVQALERSNPGSQSKEEQQDTQSETSVTGQELTKEEKQVVEEMKARDAEVRAHEQAHVAAAGGLAGSPTYEYQNGPDGKRYAVGGHVHIDTSPGNTPEETLMKAEKIKAAALAPSEPSPQDRSVASQATQMASEARMDIAQEKQQELQQQIGDGTDQDSATEEISAPDINDGIEQYEQAQRASEEDTVDTTVTIYA